LVACGCRECPDCGYQFPAPQRKRHEARASEAGVLSGQSVKRTLPVRQVAYTVHAKRDAPSHAPRSMRVTYYLGGNRWQYEWIPFEHPGYARTKAEKWWQARSTEPVPDTAADAVELAKGGALACAEFITIHHVAGERFGKIVGYRLGLVPELA